MFTKRLHAVRNFERLLVRTRLFSSGSGPSTAAADAAPAGARGPISWATLALVTVGGASAVAYYNIAKGRKQVTGQGKVEGYGQPLLGGPWSMVDGKGVPITSGSFPGQYLLLYFGFTFCPDICPNELVKMSKVVEHIGEYITETRCYVDQ